MDTNKTVFEMTDTEVQTATTQMAKFLVKKVIFTVAVTAVLAIGLSLLSNSSEASSESVE